IPDSIPETLHNPCKQDRSQRKNQNNSKTLNHKDFIIPPPPLTCGSFQSVSLSC
ncbi:unnamed protein product, partial [Gadus morhua 'NCC']